MAFRWLTNGGLFERHLAGGPMAVHLNGVLLAGRWWPDTACWLGYQLIKDKLLTRHDHGTQKDNRAKHSYSRFHSSWSADDLDWNRCTRRCGTDEQGDASCRLLYPVWLDSGYVSFFKRNLFSSYSNLLTSLFIQIKVISQLTAQSDLRLNCSPH